MDSFQPTPYSDLNAVLQALVSGTQAVLGRDFLGAYLQGSFALGDFDAHSDVDWIIVTHDELSAAQVEALQTLHGRLYALACPWAQHLEGSYFPKSVLRRPPVPGQRLWYLDNGSRELVLSDHCNSLVVRWQLREHGILLAGPPVADLLDPVPADALRREIYTVMHTWGGEILSAPERYNNRFYQGFIVLSYCRMLHSLHTGEVRSKRLGAEWAKAALDPAWAGLINRAWATRPTPEVSVRQPADPADMQQTLAFVRYILQHSPSPDSPATLLPL